MIRGRTSMLCEPRPSVKKITRSADTSTERTDLKVFKRGEGTKDVKKRPLQVIAENEAARNLLTMHRGLIVNMADHLCVSPALVRDELIHVGNYGLLDAAKRFDLTRTNKLTTFAVWRILKEMMKYIHETIPKTASETVSLFQVETKGKEGKPRALADLLSAEGPDPEQLTIAKHTLPALLATLDGRERKVVEMLDGISGREYSRKETARSVPRKQKPSPKRLRKKEKPLTPTRIGQIYQKAIKKMTKAAE